MARKKNVEEKIPEIATYEDVIKKLAVSPERQAEIDVEQSRLRELFNSRAKLNRQEYMRARGAELARHHEMTGNNDGLAEALAMQGRFQEAAAIAERKDLKSQFVEKHVAVLQDDKDCKCDNFRTEGGMRLPNQYVESYGWSEKHGQRMPFIRCSICGNLNAKPMPDYLARQKQARAQSVAGNPVRGDDFFKAR